MSLDKRPLLSNSISAKDFKEYYWLKAELTDFCARYGLKTTGGKIEIATRILHFIETGKQQIFDKQSDRQALTKASIHKAIVLDINAPITTYYNSSEPVRAFFKSVIGPHFRFTVGLMAFCKSNPTKTFNDAMHYWQEDYQNKSTNAHKPQIAPQFEYNQYIQDFMADNKGASLKEAICHWQKKRGARGDNKYFRTDIG